jgi:D-tyrosyl-tRNA(Tyr) deacylase
MRAVVQRVSRASVTIDGAEVGVIGAGLLILLGVAAADQLEDGAWLAQKIAALRIFSDSEGHMNLSLREAGGGALVVSQFTLLASTRKGARPSFNAAARPEVAVPLYEDFVQRLKQALGRDIPTGRFGAMMEVALVNDGPVTLVLDSQLKE